MEGEHKFGSTGNKAWDDPSMAQRRFPCFSRETWRLMTGSSKASGSASDSDKKRVTDLENQNIDGAGKLRELLASSADPIQTIREFQEKNDIKLPTLQPALRLLDLQNIRRVEFYEAAFNNLSELLQAKLRDLGVTGTQESTRLLLRQLQKCFALHRVPKIRPFVLETLKQLPKVPDRYLKEILKDREFYESCAVTVRQQIWVNNYPLFVEALNPVFKSYIEEKKKVLQMVDQSPTNYFTCETTKSRRQWPQIKELMSMVGQHEVLYRRLSSAIRERFVGSGDITYCSLKMEIVMSAHDLNVESIIRSDASHDLAWCLDGCVRDKHLDAQIFYKMKNIMEAAKTLEPDAIFDLSLVAGDAHVMHFLCSMIIKVLRDSAVFANTQLPRDIIPLQLLIKLLSFGASAHHILSTADFSLLQNVDVLIFTKFLPSLSTLMVEDVARYELSTAPVEIVEANPATEFLSDPNDDTLHFLESDTACALLWIHHILDLFPKKHHPVDIPGIMRYLKALPLLKDKIAFCDPWIHLIIHRLLQSIPFYNLLLNDEVAFFIIDENLLKEVDNCPSVKYQLLRMIHLMWSIIGDFRCRLLLAQIEPEKIFEPGCLDVAEADKKRYTQEYQRIRVKMTGKGAAEAQKRRPLLGKRISASILLPSASKEAPTSASSVKAHKGPPSSSERMLRAASSTGAEKGPLSPSKAISTMAGSSGVQKGLSSPSKSIHTGFGSTGILKDPVFPGKGISSEADLTGVQRGLSPEGTVSPGRGTSMLTGSTVAQKGLSSPGNC